MTTLTMDINNNSSPQLTSPSPVSSSTNQSVETIINTNNKNSQTSDINNLSNNNYDVINKNTDEKQNQSSAEQMSANSNVSRPNYQLAIEQNDSLNHLYNVPDSDAQKIKHKVQEQNDLNLQYHHQHQQQQHVTNDIVSHNPKINNASASSSLTLIPVSKRIRFPFNIILGIAQLLLSVTLTALGGLMIARNASYSNTCSGIWSGALCGITGALGVINVRKVQTGFLAMSLICIASSTLALALSGIGLVRDINSNADKGEISAGSGLIFALLLHFIVSILSVYHSAMRIWSRSLSNTQLVENAISINNSTLLSQQRVEEYIKSMSNLQSSKMPSSAILHKHMIRPSPNEYTATNVGQDKMSGLWQGHQRKPSSLGSLAQSRPIILVPAGIGNGVSIHPIYGPPSQTMSLPPQTLPTPLPPAPQPTRHLSQPLLYPVNLLPPGIIPLQYNLQHQQYPADLYKKLNRIRSIRSTAASSHNGHKKHNSRRKRRKSDSDMEAFTYTGLDRSIAESFLEQQEKHNGSTLSKSSNIMTEDVAM